MNDQSLTPEILKEKSEHYKAKARKHLERAGNDTDVVDYIIDVIGLAFDSGSLAGELRCIEKIKALTE